MTHFFFEQFKITFNNDNEKKDHLLGHYTKKNKNNKIRNWKFNFYI